jgi:TonB family protein
LKTTLVLLILAFAALDASAGQGAARGEAAEADRLNADVVKLYRAGKYDEALPVARRVVELREKALGGDDVKVAYALANLGNIYARKGDHKEAEPLFARALAVAEKRGADDFAADLNTQLGLIRVDAGKFREGEPYLVRTLEIKEKLFGAEDKRLVLALLNLADLNIFLGRPEQTHTHLGRALTLLGRPPYAKDAALVKRLRGYHCTLLGLNVFNNKELSAQVSKVAWRLEDPEKAAAFERQEKEREERAARGGAETKDGKKLVEGGVLNGKAISKPQPGYPMAAKQQRVSGTVLVQILVDESGRVVSAEAVCGHPLLAKEAVEAARGARFTPTLLSGMPVKVSGVITYNFVLQ